jgi:hypothetical protein
LCTGWHMSLRNMNSKSPWLIQFSYMLEGGSI